MPMVKRTKSKQWRANVSIAAQVNQRQERVRAAMVVKRLRIVATPLLSKRAQKRNQTKGSAILNTSALSPQSNKISKPVIPRPRLRGGACSARTPDWLPSDTALTGDRNRLIAVPSRPCQSAFVTVLICRIDCTICSRSGAPLKLVRAVSTASCAFRFFGTRLRHRAQQKTHFAL